METSGFVDLQVVDGNHEAALVTSQEVGAAVGVFGARVHPACCDVTKKGAELLGVLEGVAGKVAETEEKVFALFKSV